MTAGAPHGRCRRIDFGLKRRWKPYVRRDSDDRTDELWRCDADERVWAAVETDRLPDQRPVGVEEPLPERMRDDRHTNGRPDAIFVRCEGAADGHRDTKNLEIVAAHELASDRLRLTVRIERKRHLGRGRQGRKRPTIPQIEIVRIGRL